MEFNATATKYRPHSACANCQADLGQNFLLLVNFLHVKRPYYLMIQLVEDWKKNEYGESVYDIHANLIT